MIPWQSLTIYGGSSRSNSATVSSVPVKCQLPIFAIAASVAVTCCGGSRRTAQRFAAAALLGVFLCAVIAQWRAGRQGVGLPSATQGHVVDCTWVGGSWSRRQHARW